MAQSPPMGTNQPQPDGPTVAQVEMVLSSGVPVATMAAILGSIFGGFGVTMPVIAALLYLVLKARLPTPVGIGPAVAASLNAEAAFRAAYLTNAAVRMQNEVNQGVMLDQAIAKESRFLVLHNAAQLNRRNAAEAVDKASVGGVCGWKAVMDAKTSAECRAANGRNFRVDHPPSIGWPGAVHPHCRCRPVAPYHRGGWVEDALTPQLVGAH